MKKLTKIHWIGKLFVIIGLIVMTYLPLPGLVYLNQAVKVQAVSTSAGITIDGYYDDWEGKPIGYLTYGSHNGAERHDVSFIKDENYIYIYVKMNPLYQSPIPIYQVNLNVNGKACNMDLRYFTAQDTPDWNWVNLSNNGIYLNLHPHTSYPNNSLGDAAVTVSQGDPNDRMEIRVDINKLEKVMGLSEGTVNNGSQLTLSLPNVGAGSLQLLGTSSGYILGIVLCIGVVVAVKLYRTKKVRLLK
ncbi:MAG: hypothetical protein K0S04_1673 [Herbinix sp.]|jgi:hypothetical protein|nr:hypothetical protein [Herbinix sp.]